MMLPDVLIKLYISWQVSINTCYFLAEWFLLAANKIMEIQDTDSHHGTFRLSTYLFRSNHFVDVDETMKTLQYQCEYRDYVFINSSLTYILNTYTTPFRMETLI